VPGEVQKGLLMYGWMGRYLGGRGIGVKILWEETPPRFDPLGEENILVFATGPLTATGIPMSGKFSASIKSPLTGTIFDSNCGGDMGVRLKGCDLDLLIISGRSSTPVYLVIDVNKSQLKNATSLWGLDIPSTKAQLRQKEGASVSILAIGPAGENLVPFACCENNGRYFGRGGLGAVMGAKRLKAIVVRGRGKKPSIADDEKLRLVIYEMKTWLEANPITSQGLPHFGTGVLMNVMNETGILPIRNFQDVSSPNASCLSGEEVRGKILIGQKACPHCPVACGRVTSTGPKKGDGPEYETLWALGANLGIYHLPLVAEANYLCNNLGLDTISTGATIACAAELADKGIVQGGMKFDQMEKLLEMIEKIAYRRDEGNLLAEGSWKFADAHGVPEASMTVKGLELPAYDPRGAQGQGLAYATSHRGGCHLRAYMIGPEVLGVPKLVNRFDTQGKSGLVIFQQNLNAAMDSMVMCRFSSFAVGDDYYARLLAAVTGLEYEPQDLHVIGERIWNLERLFNLREGVRGDRDTLPSRFLKEPKNGKVVSLKPMLDEYRRFRSWDEKGVPYNDKLKRLDLLNERKDEKID
jgi:aldehyde:ferredoxin oxidoreductase